MWNKYILALLISIYFQICWGSVALAEDAVSESPSSIPAPVPAEDGSSSVPTSVPPAESSPLKPATVPAKASGSPDVRKSNLINDPDYRYRLIRLRAPANWNFKFGTGSSALKGNDIKTQKKASLVANGEMIVGIDWEKTFYNQVRSHFEYSIRTVSRQAPSGWTFSSSSGMLDRPRVYGDFPIFQNLTFYPGVSIGEFEWVEISNNTIALMKKRELTLDFGLTFLPYKFAGLKWGGSIMGQSLAFSEGGSNLDLSIEIHGDKILKNYKFILSSTSGAYLHEGSSNSWTASSLQVVYLF